MLMMMEILSIVKFMNVSYKSKMIGEMIVVMVMVILIVNVKVFVMKVVQVNGPVKSFLITLNSSLKFITSMETMISSIKMLKVWTQNTSLYLLITVMLMLMVVFLNTNSSNVKLNVKMLGELHIVHLNVNLIFIVLTHIQLILLVQDLGIVLKWN